MPPAGQLQRQFQHAARLGLGRACLLAQAHPAVDFSAAIIDVALHNYAYDRQSEGSRARYVFALYQLALRPQQPRIRRAVLRALATADPDIWTEIQLLELARWLAEHGHAPATARAAIHRRFRRDQQSGYTDWSGTKEIMALDGLSGLKYIARAYGRRLALDPEYWHDDTLLRDFQELYPEQDGRAALAALASRDADVGRYLAVVEANRRLRAEAAAEPAPDLSIEELLRYKPWFIRRRLPRRGLAEAEARELAERLPAARSHLEREKLLSCFTVVPFPLDYRLLLPYAVRNTGRHRAAAQLALDALALLTGPEIRALALKNLPTARRPARYADLLTRNYQPGDAALLSRLVERSRSEEAVEALAASCCRIYEANVTPECAGPLLALYEKMNCAIHRYYVVKLLIRNDVLPAWLSAELPFDSYADTRGLAAAG
ncbi:hypothetical protein EJV47_22530 [Hymenobacter gummosus]|uniref:Uncharacterized protein n=1 Tax=Hymenobacter gummosus TaxID=1776032 RepID=A0A3S0J6Y8_9BACT|nr:hypothetical protein [Hymenobacter gummosus]RTQ46304.1 hypothetical protein EJV47_22530 [Hymenobacter gummosus]